MGRRSDHSRDALRAMALDAAQELVEIEGISALSARKIMGKVGYTVGTLYNIYTNFDDVILHLNARTLDALHTHLQQTLSETNDDMPYTLAQGYIDFSCQNFPLWHLLFTHRPAEATPLPAWYTEKVDRLFALVEQTLRPLLKNDIDAKEATKVLWAGLHGICTLSLHGKLDTAGAQSAQYLATLLVQNYISGANA